MCVVSNKAQSQELIGVIKTVHFPTFTHSQHVESSLKKKPVTK